MRLVIITNLSKNKNLTTLQLNIKLYKYLKIIKILQNPNLEKLMNMTFIFRFFPEKG